MYNTFIFYAPFSKNMQGVEMLCCYYVYLNLLSMVEKKLHLRMDKRYFPFCVGSSSWSFASNQRNNTGYFFFYIDNYFDKKCCLSRVFKVFFYE